MIEEWCIPPKQNAAFVAEMEQVLDEYQRPYDPRFPSVCMDESSKQLIADVQDPLPLQPGQVERQDCNYQRLGVGNLFVAFEPARGQRDVTVTSKRGKAEWAAYVKKIVDELYPQAEVITLVCDQLNTHSLSSLYATFPAPEAHRIACKLRIVHTPKHGSWLNMAEIEFSALSRQCTDRRFDSLEHLQREVAAWTLARNTATTTVHWRFTTDDARIKLASLYPKFGT
jgi:hypothetical protein